MSDNGVESFPASPTVVASVYRLPASSELEQGLARSVGHLLFCVQTCVGNHRGTVSCFSELLFLFFFDKMDIKNSCCAKVSSLLQEENKFLF